MNSALPSVTPPNCAGSRRPDVANRQIATRAPDRARFQAAIRRTPSDQVPYYESEFAPAIVSGVLGKPVDCRSYDLPAEDYVELLGRVGVDVGYLHVAWDFGRRRVRDDDGSPAFIDGLIRDRDDLKAEVRPSLDPVRARIETFLNAAAHTRLGWIYVLPTPSAVMRAMGYEAFFLKLYDEPDFVDEVLDRYQEHALAVTELVLAYRPDAVLLGSNLCQKTGLIMSREQAERFILSRMDLQMSVVRTAGVPAMLHADGDNSALMTRWIEMGMAAIHPCEACPGFDIYELKARYGGRIALCGNVDVTRVLVPGTPEQVRQETLMHLERLSPGGGYLCGSSHDVGAQVPLVNLAAMIRTVCDFRGSETGSVR